MPETKLTIPHSVADWDFSHSSTYRELSAIQYVSSPTSLRLFQVGAGSAYHTALCRLASTLNLPEGELRTWRRFSRNNINFMSFRNQAALGTSNYLNCYFILLNTTNSLLRRYFGGGPSDFSLGPSGTVANTWQHYRVVWFNGKTPGGTPALVVKLYLEVAGDWVQPGITAYDTLNLYAGSPINRTGLAAQCLAEDLDYYDDTEIWGPL